MGGTCTSRCTPYIRDVGAMSHAIIDPNEYSSCGVPAPKILLIRIDRDLTNPDFDKYVITFSRSDGGKFSFTVLANTDPKTINISGQPQGAQISHTFMPDFFNTIINVKLIQLSDDWNPYYVPNDMYKIALTSDCNRDVVSTGAVFERQEGGKVRTGTSAGTAAASTTTAAATTTATAAVNSLSFNLPISPIRPIPACEPDICDSIRIPQINITAQTTIDGSDVGDAIFTIFDEFDYYNSKHHPIPENNCMIRYIKLDEVKETAFRQCCPYMVSVIRGKGKTFLDRILSIYNKLGEVKIGVSLRLFYQYVVLYGLSKYILSRLLYGDFNIDYLLGKYNEKFLEDLGNSRFCGFIEFFEDCESPVRGYNKYFKFDN